jgi:hypothetical protein
MDQSSMPTEKAMTKTVMWWFAVGLLSALCLSWASTGNSAFATGIAGEGLADDPRLDMVTALKALGPHPSLGDQAEDFARLVGTWNVEYNDFSKEGKVTHRSGEFIVGWVMDGRVVQDVWIVYPSGAGKDREVYTDLRYYDPKSRTWHAAFIDPEHASLARFKGSVVGNDRIVLNTQDFEGTDTRWSIHDIRPNSFVWREEESRDGAKTWRLLAQHHMTRRGPAPPTLSVTAK